MGDISATFNYLAPVERLVPPEPPFRYVSTRPEGRPEHNEVVEGHVMKVKDIRDDESHIGLDKSGFGVLHDVPTDFNDWNSDEHIKSDYYADVERLLKSKLGVTRVVFFDHTVRRRQLDKEAAKVEDVPEDRQPVYRVHIDQTPAAGRIRVIRHLGEEEGTKLLQSRVQIINVWRPLHGPVIDAPLGLCDARTLKPANLVAARFIYPDFEGTVYLVHHDPSHEWYYLSNMQPDEVLLLKCYDNKVPDVISPHSGFSVPAGPDVRPRESIEVRCIVFWEDHPIV